MLNNFELVKKVINKNDLEKKDNFNDTALIDSVRNNNTEISKLLICYGANINIKDSNNLSLIDIATRNENIKIINLLNVQNIKEYCLENNNLKKKQIVVLKKAIVLKKQITNNNKYIPKYNEIQKEIDEINLDDKFIKKDIIIKKKSLKQRIRLIKLNSNIILDKNNLYFNFKNGELNESMKEDVNVFMDQFLKIISTDKDNIRSIILETYTSSEYRTKKTIKAKNKANKILSYNRAIKIKSYILSKYASPRYTKSWLNKTIKINAMGSNSIIYDKNNFEDKEKSKRSIFKVFINSDT